MFQILLNWPNGLKRDLKSPGCRVRAVHNVIAFTWVEPDSVFDLDPGLQSHASFEVAKRLLPKGCGGILGFGIKPSDNKSGAELGKAFIDATNLPYHAANLGVRRNYLAHADLIEGL